LNKPDDAWRHLKVISTKSADDLEGVMPKYLHEIVVQQVKLGREANEKIWQAGKEPAWETAWNEVTDELGLGELDMNALVDDWSEGQGLLAVAKEIESEWDVSDFEEFLQQTMNLARWHPAIREEVREVLRGPASKLWPDSAEKLRALADAMEKAPEAK